MRTHVFALVHMPACPAACPHPGSVPTAWSGLVRVREIGLSNNALTGSLPALIFKALPHLAHLDVSGNRQMCGQLSDVPLNATVVAEQTGLGSRCSESTARGLSTLQAIGVGA